MLTPAILQRCMPQAPAPACEVYAPAIWSAAIEFGQDAPNRLAAMLASAANESGQLTKFEEMSWFATPWARAISMFHYCPSQTNYEAWKGLGRAEFDRRFFDAVYGPMMGNRGQGYKYRGLGLGQLTGHDNDKQIGEAIGVDLVANPELMRDDPVVGARAFAAYCKINHITDPAVDGTEAGFLASVHKSNPGLDPTIFRTHHLARWHEVRAGLGLDVSGNPNAPDPKTALRLVQDHLLAAGFDPKGVDGLMGPNTRAALRAFQVAQGLTITGEPDDVTKAALGIVT